MLSLAFLTTRNVGNRDRLLRALPVLFTAWAWWHGMLDGTWLVLAAIVSAMLLSTALLGACSIYYVLGWSTCPISDKPS